MSVRGTTHARHEKRVINLDRGGTFVCCAWDECDNDGFEIDKVRTHEHAHSIACDSNLARHCNYVFCSERHKQYWLNCTGEGQGVGGAEPGAAVGSARGDAERPVTTLAIAAFPLVLPR